jgi:hypothetical protein
VVEGQPARLQRGARQGVVRTGQQRVDALAADRVPHGGQLGEQGIDVGAPVVVPPGPGVAVAGQQHLGFDLAEAVEHRHRAHVGRADAPDRAQAGHGEEHRHRLRRVGQHGDDAIARLDTQTLQGAREGGDLGPQPRPGDLAQPAAREQFLVGKDDGRVAGGVCGVGVAEHLMREVDLRALEPARAGHHLAVEHALVRRGRLDVEVIPDRLPERRQVIDRPAPERVVVGEGQAALRLQPALVVQQTGGGAHARW